MICLLQVALGCIQVRLEPKAGFILVTRTAFYAFCIFFQFTLIHNVLSAFEPVVAVSALDLCIDVLYVGKFHRGPAPTGEYFVLIQGNIIWLSVQVDRPQASNDTQNHHQYQKTSPSHSSTPDRQSSLRPCGSGFPAATLAALPPIDHG
jgi:hypothetical protein